MMRNYWRKSLALRGLGLEKIISSANNACMARTPDKRETHTIESISHVAAELEQLAAKLRTSASLLKMEGEPPIPSVGVRYEPALVGGLTSMRTWVNEVQECAHDARREAAKKAARNGGVRQIGHVSGGSKKNAKIPAETPINSRNSHT